MLHAFQPGEALEGDDIAIASGVLKQEVIGWQGKSPDVYRAASSFGLYRILHLLHAATGKDPLLLFTTLSFFCGVAAVAVLAALTKRLTGIGWLQAFAATLLLQEVVAAPLYANDSACAFLFGASGAYIATYKFRGSGALAFLMLVLAAAFRLDYLALLPATALLLGEGSASSNLKRAAFAVFITLAGIGAAFSLLSLHGAGISDLVAEVTRHRYHFVLYEMGPSRHDTFAVLFSPLNVALIALGIYALITDKRPTLVAILLGFGLPFLIVYFDTLTTPKYLLPAAIGLAPLQGYGFSFLGRLRGTLRTSAMACLILLSFLYFIDFSRSNTAFIKEASALRSELNGVHIAVGAGRHRITHDDLRLIGGQFFLPLALSKARDQRCFRNGLERITQALDSIEGRVCFYFAKDVAWWARYAFEAELIKRGFTSDAGSALWRQSAQLQVLLDESTGPPPEACPSARAIVGC